MAILSIDRSQESKNREIEIKQIINTLLPGFEARIQIDCKISAYRTSFYHFLGQYNTETKFQKKFSIIGTIEPLVWIIKRVDAGSKNEVDLQTDK